MPQEPLQKPEMRLAEILSDLVSLRVCDPAAALALVSAKPSQISDHPTEANEREEQDVDLQRAKELVKLHYEVREAHKRGGLSRGLEEARSAVARAVGEE